MHLQLFILQLTFGWNIFWIVVQLYVQWQDKIWSFQIEHVIHKCLLLIPYVETPKGWMPVNSGEGFLCIGL